MHSFFRLYTLQYIICQNQTNNLQIERRSKKIYRIYILHTTTNRINSLKQQNRYNNVKLGLSESQTHTHTPNTTPNKTKLLLVTAKFIINN